MSEKIENPETSAKGKRRKRTVRRNPKNSKIKKSIDTDLTDILTLVTDIEYAKLTINDYAIAVRQKVTIIRGKLQSIV